MQAFVNQQHGSAWGRIVDLSEWVVTAADVNEFMIAALRQEVIAGLRCEAIVVPRLPVGKWQVEKTLQAVNQPGVFSVVKNLEEAKARLSEQGFDLGFGEEQKFTGR